MSAKPEAQRQRDTVLLILSVGFLCGAILGGLAEGNLSAAPHIQRFLQVCAQEARTPVLWRELWVTFRWPVAIIMLSLLPFVGLTVPVLFFLRGFLLSYGIVSLAAGSGVQGMLWAGLLFGPACVLTLPVMFLLGTECLMKKVGSDKDGKKVSLRMLLCVPALILCVFLNQRVVPPVLHFFLQALSGDP